MARDAHREQQIRDTLKNGRVEPIDTEDVQSLLDEIDYLRGEVQSETAYATELKRQLEAR